LFLGFFANLIAYFSVFYFCLLEYILSGNLWLINFYVEMFTMLVWISSNLLYLIKKFWPLLIWVHSIWHTLIKKFFTYVACFIQFLFYQFYTFCILTFVNLSAFNLAYFDKEVFYLCCLFYSVFILSVLYFLYFYLY
jgi:hypothetical protein